MKTFLKNKKITAGLLAIAMLVTVFASMMGIDKVRADAVDLEDYGKFQTYYEIEFVDNTSDEIFTGAFYADHTKKIGKELNFKFNLSRNFKLRDQTKIDRYSYTFTNEDMVKLNSLDDLKYRTKESYAYYNVPNIELATFVELVATDGNDDYYIGDISIRSTTKKINGEDVNVFVLSTPILKLNRNIEKTIIDYEGELNEASKLEIIEKVNKTNPNINNLRKMRIEGDKLIIETWNRYHTNIPYLEMNVEDLIKRVKNAETQTESPETKDEETQTQVEVIVKYLFEDGKVYKEEKVNADIGAVLDSGDIPTIPNDMKFVDDFLFYEVKSQDNMIERKVAYLSEDKETQTDDTKIDDKSTQTELEGQDVSELEKKTEEMSKELENLQKEIENSKVMTKEQADKIEKLEKEKSELEKALEEAKKINEEATKDSKSKENKETAEKIKALEEKLVKLEESLKESNNLIQESKKENLNKESVTKTDKTDLPKTTEQVVTKNSQSDVELKDKKVTENNTQTNKSVNPYGDTSKTTKVEDKAEKTEKETDVRYPNKLTAKQPLNSQQNNTGTTNSQINTNKGVASEPSKARGTVTENVDNANKDFPIHHGSEALKEDGCYQCPDVPYYSADARQFVTFTTKNGKSFYLIINHDEDSENVMLLTEVSEDDLLNMVETKEKPVKEEPIKVEEPETKPVEKEPVKKEEQSNAGMYLLVGLVLVAVLGAGYYFKVVKQKEQKELIDFEEDDDEYYVEASDDYEDLDEEDIDSSELL